MTTTDRPTVPEMTTRPRRGVAMSVLVRSATAAVLAGAALLGTSAVAASQPPPAPNCSVADQAGVLSGVSASLSAYMFTHPDVNWFFTSLRGLPPDERRAKVATY